MKGRLKPAVPIIVALILLPGGAFMCRWGGSDVQPQSLLVTPPELPTLGRLLGRMGTVVPINLLLTESASASISKSGWCGPFGTPTARVWTNDGVLLATPKLIHGVCREPSEPLAWLYYRWASLGSAAGEDWPNFDFGREDRIVPDHLGMTPSADDFEVGCGAGAANALCSVWVYRARYGPFLVIVLYISSSGIGLTSEEFGGLIEQFDSAIMARL